MINITLVTGLLLLAIQWLCRFDLIAQTASDVLKAAGVSRAQGYRMKGRLTQVLPTYAPQVGRPRKPTPPAPPDALSLEIVKFLYDYPGSVCRGPGRMHYSDAFRLFLIGWVESHPEHPLPTLAKAAKVLPDCMRCLMSLWSHR